MDTRHDIALLNRVIREYQLGLSAVDTWKEEQERFGDDGYRYVNGACIDRIMDAMDSKGLLSEQDEVREFLEENMSDVAY